MAITTVPSLFHIILLAVLPFLSHPVHAQQAALAFKAFVTEKSPRSPIHHTSSSPSKAISLIASDPIVLGWN